MDPIIIVIIVVIIAGLGVGGFLVLRRRRQPTPALPSDDDAPGMSTLAEKALPGAESAPPRAPTPGTAPAFELLDDGITAALEIVDGPAAVSGGQVLPARIPINRKKVTIGRNPRQVDIQLYNLDEQSSVSRLHCTIEYYKSVSCFMLTDEGSSSGTKLSGMPLIAYQPTALQDGDTIELGLPEKKGAVLRFRTNANPPASLELRGGRLRVHMGIEAKDTIRQSLDNLGVDAAKADPRDVFLSYSRSDRDVMRYIRESLTVSGVTVWTDESLEPGSKMWRTVVEKAIENARCVVAILSPDSKQSQWVGEELNYAKIHGVPIFTVLVRGDEGNAVPLGLTGVQWVDMRLDYETGLESLLRTLRQHLGKTG